MPNCKQCQSPFEITPEDRELYDKVAPVFNGKRYDIPDPLYCPDCRLQRRMLFRNEHKFYKRNSSLSGKPLISIYSPDKPDTIYSYDEWWGDSWDATDYRRDYDFNRPFFDQFQELFLEVPKLNLIQDGTSENCDYTNYGAQNKNCYMSVCVGSEDIYYAYTFFSRNCCDCWQVNNGEKIYECIDSDNCYNSAYLQNCDQCSDSYFLESCTGCKNCLGCKNLKNKQYFIFNKPFSKEEYESEIKEYHLDSYAGLQNLKKRFDAFKLTLPFRFSQSKSSENSTGDFLNGAKNCHHCFKVVGGAEDCRYALVIGLNCHDIIDSCHADGELHCEADGMLNSRHVLYSHFARNCSEISYCVFSYNSEHLFGCTGLNRKKYCILNKPYSKEEWEALVPKIIEHMKSTGEWGQYFPPKLSSFGYNESYSHDLMPLTKEGVQKLGFKWSDYEQKVEGARTIPAARLPDKISDIPDDILNWAIVCEATGRPFKIIPQELRFYRQQQLPIPHRHPDQRFLDRCARRNPYHLWKRQCAKCGSAIQTSYSPERPELVYCEACYLSDVY